MANLLILTLKKLKELANAASVGSTATTTLPSLCPPKSTIAGYVTNGSSIVNITGNLANNLLVPEANITINATLTVDRNEEIYESVSVGTFASVGDIPARGGSSYATATVTYKLFTRTYYTNGTYTDGTKYDKSTTVTGSTVSANSLGTTVASRASKGNSTYTGTVAGQALNLSCAIYQVANTATYGDVTGTLTLSVGDIPASGGTKTTSDVTSTKNCSLTVTFTSGSSRAGTITYGNITGANVTGSNLSNTEKARTLLKSNAFNITATGEGSKTKVAYCSVYLEANVRLIGAVTFDLSTVPNIPASGGTSNAPTVSNVKLGDTYTSGYGTAATLSSYTVYYAVNNSNPTSTDSNLGKITAASKGTTSSGESLVGTVYVKVVSPDNQATTKSVAVKLNANTVTYGNLTLPTAWATIPDTYVPASGGKAIVRTSELTFSSLCLTITYSSGSTRYGSITWNIKGKDGTIYTPSQVNSSGNIESNYTLSNLGTTLKAQTTIENDYFLVILIGEGSKSVTITTTDSTPSIILRLNNITLAKVVKNNNSLPLFYYASDISAAGGSLTPTTNHTVLYTFASGSTVTSSSSTPVTGCTATITKQFTKLSTIYDSSYLPDAFTLNNSSTGQVTATNRGSIIGARRRCRISGQINVSILYASNLRSLSIPTYTSNSDLLDVWLQANEADPSGIEPYVYRYFGPNNANNINIGSTISNSPKYFIYSNVAPPYGFSGNGTAYYSICPFILYNRIKVGYTSGYYESIPYDSVIGTYGDTYDEIGSNNKGIPSGTKIYRIGLYSSNGSTWTAADGACNGFTFKFEGALITASTSSATSIYIKPGFRVKVGDTIVKEGYSSGYVTISKGSLGYITTPSTWNISNWPETIPYLDYYDSEWHLNNLSFAEIGFFECYSGKDDDALLCTLFASPAGYTTRASIATPTGRNIFLIPGNNVIDLNSNVKLCVVSTNGNFSTPYGFNCSGYSYNIIVPPIPT